MNITDDDDKDPMGTRLKGYESVETGRHLDPTLPVYCRIDGRGFSKFTRRALKPFDESIRSAMQEATRELISQTKPLIAYVQSDEISLAWDSGMVFFDGKIQKITSVVSGIATAAFIKHLINDPVWNERDPEWLNRLPHFDARVFNMPAYEVVNTFLWRLFDARKNAITMIATSLYSHKELQNRNSAEKIEMILARGVDYHEIPAMNRYGTFMRRVVREVVIDEKARLAIPEKHRPDAGTTVVRSFIEPIDMIPFDKVTNRHGFIFNNEDPIGEM